MTALRDALRRSGSFEVVATGGVEERAWLDCELATLAENRLGDGADPLTLDPGRRAMWLARATGEPRRALAARDGEIAYWLVEDGARVGTIALSDEPFGGGRSVLVSGLYVLRSHRGRGVGRRCLDRLGGALRSEGLGYCLSTSWSWRRTVRFYVDVGLWVKSWKHDLDFAWYPDLPAPHVEVRASEVSVGVARGDGEIVPLARARPDGDSFVIDSAPPEIGDDPEIGHAWWIAESTLSLVLALEGRPLVRSEAMARELRGLDGGPPEALAARIQAWEARDHARGWRDGSVPR